MIRQLAILTVGAALVVVVALAVERPWVSDGDEAVTEFHLPSPIAAMDFRLVDQNEQLVTPSDLLGNPSIVFFGFTYCPDVCPTTLTTISSWLQQLGDDAERFNVIFVSIDPDRDTPSDMASYVAAFHPQIQGWTGSPAEIANIADDFGVTYEKVSLNSSYTMNHTAGVFLYDASGRFVTIIDSHEAPSMALQKLQRALGSSEP